MAENNGSTVYARTQNDTLEYARVKLTPAVELLECVTATYQVLPAMLWRILPHAEILYRKHLRLR